jgi:hypothetical protein
MGSSLVYRYRSGSYRERRRGVPGGRSSSWCSEIRYPRSSTLAHRTDEPAKFSGNWGVASRHRLQQLLVTHETFSRRSGVLRAYPAGPGRANEDVGTDFATMDFRESLFYAIE